MKKYLNILRVSLSNLMVYRVRILIDLILGFITPLVLVSALLSAKKIGDIDARTLIPYYLLVAVTEPIVRSEIDEKIRDCAESGEIINYLLKPVSYYFWLLAEEIGKRIYTLVILMPLMLLVGWFLTKYGFAIQFGENWLVLVFSLVVSFWLSFNFAYAIGLFAFWLEDFWAINNLKRVLITLLGGVVLPYSFFPTTVSKLLALTPFPFFSTWTARILEGKTAENEILIALFWCCFFYLFSEWFWKITIRKYERVAN